ncbi:D-lactate dehydrogenase (cytochrome) [Bacillus pakistanensis]|uniref:D-lactate dehydrogenase (cytochrome) n=1 Tax=Rossellomorea pakistanensis TaxID=992288 RepID=A0ABS2NIY2_9BACI|nr:FAD-linked oxidase C-terminal domain-containing protein [Bacillus pakistanensis]MBM7587734.1 D-lactate dehydrogenase (cytochrome) [Bacillus pakistanensis]
MDCYKELKSLLTDDQVSINETILREHSFDESSHPPVFPSIVVFPHTTLDIQKVVDYANKNMLPITPYGIGSGLEGQAIPIKQGISIDFQQMNNILEIRPEDLVVRVQPGVTREQLNRTLKKHGLFFPIDPGADATIGGMASTNASGTTAVRYGAMRQQVLDMEVVLINGKVIRTGSLASKSSSGYNITNLFVGSEGTLGVFSEITLKVHGIPETISAGRACFQSVKECGEAAVALLTSGVSIGRIELVDERSIIQMNKYHETSFEERPTLFIEITGNASGVQHDVSFTKEILEEYNCSSLFFESDSKKRALLWRARHELSYAFRHPYPHLSVLGTDVCVPLSSLPRIVEMTRKEIDSLHLDGAIFGHVGDGNFHTLILFDPNSPSEREKAERLNETIVSFALKCGGTCTGEHGVGLGKQKFQRLEHGDSLDIMIGIKHLLDPNNLLNPGKIFSDTEIESLSSFQK